MKILLTGARGMLGRDIHEIFEAAGHEVIATDRQELDITDAQAARNFVLEKNPDVIINTAAYNLVDQVEDEQYYPIAFAVNATGPGNLAAAAKEAGIPLVHYSTDYVFAGDKPEGYSEEDETGPISKYGETKEAGEKAVLTSGADVYLCRLSKIFGRPGLSEGSKESMVALMLRLAKEKPELKVVDEEIGMPTYTKDIAEATLTMLEEKFPVGIYHIVNSGEGVTPYAFTREIFDIVGVETPLHPCPRTEFPRPSDAPKFAKLLNTKFPPLRPRAEAIREFLKVMND